MVAGVLIFIAGKLVFGLHISPITNFMVVMAMLAFGVVASLLWPETESVASP